MIKQKRILLVSPFFYPEPISTGKFNTDIALALKDLNYDVTVLCSHPFYPEWKPIKTNQTIKGLNIVRGGRFVRYPKSLLIRRAVLEVWFALFILKNISLFRKHFDIILTIFPPSLSFNIIIPFLKKEAKKIGVVHDLQEIYISKSKGYFNKIIGFFINKIEGRSLRACDKLIFLSNEMKKEAKMLYNLTDEKLEVQYPFVNINTNKITNDLNNILSQDKKHVVYSGALGKKQYPDKLYEFYEYASKKLENTEFHFFSQGPNFENLKNYNKNNKIKFHPLVSEKHINELYKKSNVQIIPQYPGSSKGSLPSKLPNLLASGSNILIITDKNSEIEKLFNKYNLDGVVNLWDNELICTKLNELIEKGPGPNINQMNVARNFFKIDYMINKIIEK